MSSLWRSSAAEWPGPELPEEEFNLQFEAPGSLPLLVPGVSPHPPCYNPGFAPFGQILFGVTFVSALGTLEQGSWTAPGPDLGAFWDLFGYHFVNFSNTY